MASIVTRNGKYYPRVYISGKQVKFSPGLTNKRLAQRTADRIEELVASRAMGEISLDLRAWLKEIQETPLYDKLAQLELVEERQKPHTLGDLLTAFLETHTDVAKSTRENYQKAMFNLQAYFGDNKVLTEITKSDVEKFYVWLRSEKLNKRRKNPQKYGEATINRRVNRIKQFFKYAQRLDWIVKSPFEILKGGESVNPDKLEYVPIEKVLRVMEYSPLKWRVLLALVRFCGIRGASEAYRMEWSDIHWSSPQEPGWIAIRAKKNKRHGRRFRMVPLSPVVEQVLSDWFHQSREGEPLVFPGMKAQQNFSVMTEKLAVRALGNCWLNPWYNLRKSFCCDLLPVVRDIATYEAITDHSYAVAMRHYQIMTKGRTLKGIEQAATLFSNISLSSHGSPLLPPMNCTESNLADCDAETACISRNESIEKRGLKWGLAQHCRKM